MPSHNVHIPLTVYPPSPGNPYLLVESNDSETLFKALRPILASPGRKSGAYAVLPQNKEALGEILLHVFGYRSESERIDMAKAGKLCRVRLCLDRWPDGSSFELFGFQWVWRNDKKHPIRKHPLVSILPGSGGLPDTGGSIRAPTLSAKPGTMLEAQCVAESAAHRALRVHPELFAAKGAGIFPGTADDAAILSSLVEKYKTKKNRAIHNARKRSTLRTR